MGPVSRLCCDWQCCSEHPFGSPCVRGVQVLLQQESFRESVLKPGLRLPEHLISWSVSTSLLGVCWQQQHGQAGQEPAGSERGARGAAPPPECPGLQHQVRLASKSKNKQLLQSPLELTFMLTTHTSLIGCFVWEKWQWA